MDCLHLVGTQLCPGLLHLAIMDPLAIVWQSHLEDPAVTVDGQACEREAISLRAANHKVFEAVSVAAAV